MATGYSAAGSCWATQQEALDAYYSNWTAPSSPAGDPSTGQPGTYFITALKSGSTWYLRPYSCNSYNCYAPQSQTPAPTNVTGTCTLQDPASNTGGGTTTPTTYDYDAMAQFWFFGLSIIVSFFVLGRGAGVVLDVFRK